MDSIVTPEAVQLSFETAGLGSRMVATFIDLAVQAAVLFGLIFGASLVANTPFGYAGGFVAVFVVLFAAPIAVETLWRGKSVGRLVMRLRVITVEGAPVQFRHALVRGALALVDLWLTFGAVGVMAVLLTPRNQRLGDLAAGTIVVREGSGARMLSAVTWTVPPGWETYAATLDVSGVSATDYGAVRSFLLRAPSLTPLRRDQIAGEIAMPLLARTNHRPPAGVTAEAFLHCLAAAYQERQRQVGARVVAAREVMARPVGVSAAVPAMSVDAVPAATGFVPPA